MVFSTKTESKLRQTSCFLLINSQLLPISLPSTEASSGHYSPKSYHLPTHIWVHLAHSWVCTFIWGPLCPVWSPSHWILISQEANSPQIQSVNINGAWTKASPRLTELSLLTDNSIFTKHPKKDRHVGLWLWSQYWEAKAGGLWILVQPVIYSESKVILGYRQVPISHYPPKILIKMS